ncbi:hypothetical protein COO60DRAFT_1706134 [Scenedesmus sp. NREL 46B-D3]|nr:hypothetical protein COO60DRAFT_1706134 [Scenedesmus sp. NREL 46B-D3]
MLVPAAACVSCRLDFRGGTISGSDYSMFNVDVTTINQIAAGTANQNYMRVSIGGSSSMLGMSAGGAAYTGVFGRSDKLFQPAFVFSSDLGRGFPKDVWEAVSYKVGHTMGLLHDGQTKADGSVDAYYGGASGWAPIMGAGCYQPLSQWSKGEYQGANQKQDDLAIIAAKLGYAPAGNGNSLATAAALVPTISAGTATATATGIVAQTAAADMFKLQANTGTLPFSVYVLTTWGSYGRSNLDAAVKVLDASSREVASVQNTNGLVVTGTAALSSAGTYYLPSAVVALGIDVSISDGTEVQLIYACAGIAVPADYVPAATVEAAAAAEETLNGLRPITADPSVDRVWALSSRPEAVKKIWLDFRGGTISGSVWNDASRPNVVVPPYSTDADTASFTITELSNIDYSMFNVDVTTINQIAAGTANQNYMRVSIGGSSSMLGMSAGGVAYVGVFGRSDKYYHPAFVFANELGRGFPKHVWEAVSHEVGHTMGLSHDGRKKADGTVEAYYGGANGWAPIMGVGYSQPLSQWSKGEYQGSNQQQDDLAVIAGKLSYAPARNGNSLATAAALVPTISAGTATATVTGIVAQTAATDMFKLQANAGTMSFSVSVLTAWGSYGRSNLDAAVKVLDASGRQVASVQNTNGLAVTGTAALPSAGTYYVAVSGSGSGDPLTTGYSAYASLGQFSLLASYPVNTTTTRSGVAPSLSPALLASQAMTASVSKSVANSNDDFFCIK